MPATSVTSNYLPGVGSSLEVSLTVLRQEEGGEVAYDLEVQEGTAALAIAVTDTGGSGIDRGPVNVDLAVVGPRDRRFEVRATETGQLVLVEPKPEPGRWRILIRYHAGARAELSASAVHTNWKERIGRSARWLRCKTCKISLKAFVVAAIAYLAPIAVSALGASALAAQVIQIAPHLLDALVLLFSNETARKLLEMLAEYFDEPIEKLLERACHLVRLCPA